MLSTHKAAVHYYFDLKNVNGTCMSLKLACNYQVLYYLAFHGVYINTIYVSKA